MFVIGVVAFVAGAVAVRWLWWWLAGVQAARAIFATAHVVEVRAALAPLRRAALDAIDGEPLSGPSDARVFVSTAGLVVTYSMRPHAGAFLHHVGVSHARGYTPHHIGATFVALVIEDLGLPIGRTNLAVFPSTIHHAQALLDRPEHLAVVSMPLPTIHASDVPARIRRAIEVGSQVTWKRLVAAGDAPEATGGTWSAP